MRELKNDLDQRGIVSAVKLSRKGRRRGGKPFSRGALYCLLSNRIYLGEIRHKQQSHPGQHEPIMSRELWERVQAKLFGHADHRASSGRRLRLLARSRLRTAATAVPVPVTRLLPAAWKRNSDNVVDP